MRRAIRHGGILRCDVSRCSQRFVSYSIIGLIRMQARDAGWGRVPEWQVKRGGSNELRDICPSHTALAKAKHAEREAARVAERVRRAEQRKADRAELRAAKQEVRRAKRELARIERANARAADRAAIKAARRAVRNTERDAIRAARDAERAATRESRMVARNAAREVARAQRKAKRLERKVKGGNVYVAGESN